jgi:putative glutamine amidotransferase
MAPTVLVTRGARPVDPYRRALEWAGARVVEVATGTPAAQRAREDPEGFLAPFDGLLLPGGADIAPHRYGQTSVHPTVTIDAERDELELALARAAVAQGLPVLGICRGIQTLNVALGGTLWQDLPSEHPSAVRHRDPAPADRRRLLHPVAIRAGTLLHRILGREQLWVNSLHHQAVRDLAPGLRPCAEAPDAIVEGAEAPDRPFVLGVQWHPEELWDADPAHAALFAAFCRAAAGG